MVAAARYPTLVPLEGLHGMRHCLEIAEHGEPVAVRISFDKLNWR
jgi:hypothetical protein